MALAYIALLACGHTIFVNDKKYALSWEMFNFHLPFNKRKSHYDKNTSVACLKCIIKKPFFNYYELYLGLWGLKTFAEWKNP